MVSHSMAGVDGLEVSYLEAGDIRDPLMVLLHGFPDSPDSWADTADWFGERGYHVVAPWLRGYAPTDVPADGNYQGGAYVRDVIRLHDVLGGDHRAVLVGHDIGAAIAYGAASAAADRWSRVVTISVPPLPLLTQMMLDYVQLRRSWYTFFFQHPAAEAIVAAGDFAFIEHLWAEWSPGLHHDEALHAAKKALSAPGRVGAALGWYRAGFHPETNRPELGVEQAALSETPKQPWLYLHGESDGCIGSDAVWLVGHGVTVNDAGHFPHLEAPAAVRESIATFLRESTG
ncbi:MAG: alpha/beta hydrolase [Mycobacterium sp.]|nr:MAG: alpha/beta hydrolase [Mycobacterium sp.]PJE24718.1 MAG: alpha/beta hydrolase [Mycobacterium sp.]